MSSVKMIQKRNGQKEPFAVEKFQRQVDCACEGIPKVSSSMIQIKTQLQYHDGITTAELDSMIYKSAEDLINDPEMGHPNYQYVAGRIRSFTLRKEVYGQYTPPPLYDIVTRNVEAGLYTDELLQWYSKDEWDRMDKMIDHTKDEHFSAAAITQMVDKYLVRNRATKQIYETPQVRYIVAAATCFHMDPPGERMARIKRYYAKASKGDFTLPTPVLAGLGSKTKQFSSCVLIKAGDSLDSIFAAGEIMGKYASKRAGIGLDVGRIRGLNSPIRGGEILHTGLVPFIRKWLGDLRCCSQGGIRNASCTVTYPVWHIDFEDLIVLKNNQGTAETRVRQLDYSVVVNKMFWRRYREGKNITLFDPNDVPEMYNAFYTDTAEFERLYEANELRTDIRKKVLPAAEVMKSGLVTERSDTGRIFILNIDNVMNQGPFDPQEHVVYQSNLCQEILLPTKEFNHKDDDSGRISLCTLGSMNWGNFDKPQDMREACHILVRSLSNILGYQDYLSVQSRLANEELEPLGIGITNLAYWHAKRGYKYGDAQALADVKTWIEHQTYYLIEASIQLAIEKGPCTDFHKTRYGQGKFVWENRAKGVNELTDFTPSADLDWELLRERMVTFGMRNGTLGAIAPVESSSVVINSTNGIALPKSLITTKESKSGNIVQVVPEYDKLKKQYQLMWDQVDCIGYLKTAAVLGAYIDQSISTDTYYNPAHFPNKRIPGTLVIKNIMLAHHWGIKTLYYNLNNKMGIKTSDEVADDFSNDVANSEDCESCKL